MANVCAHVYTRAEAARQVTVGYGSLEPRVDGVGGSFRHMHRLKVGDVCRHHSRMVGFKARVSDVPRVVLRRVVDRSHVNLLIPARRAQMDYILQRHALKHLEVSDLLNSRPPLGGDALVRW